MFSFPKQIGYLVVTSAVLFFPFQVSAQSYVPVNDADLIADFEQYMEDFTNYVTDFDNTFGGQPNGTTDAIRDLLSGSNPGGIAQAECVKGNALLDAEAEADTSPWGRTSASTSGDVPRHIPDGGGMVQVNRSHSLRCLLEEIVQYQKLSASTQIHQILLQYISNAQVKELNNRLASQIAAANGDFEKSGRTFNDGGVNVSEPLYDTSDASTYNVGDREVKHLSQQITADPADPIGGLGMYDGFQLDAAQQSLNSGEKYSVDPYDLTQEQAEQTMEGASGVFADAHDYEIFMANPNTDRNLYGFWGTYQKMLNEPQNSGLGALDLGSSMAQIRAQKGQEGYKQDMQNGFDPTIVHVDDPEANPYSIRRYQTKVTPATHNENVTQRTAETGINQIQSADAVGEEPTGAARDEALQINSPTGFSGYNVNPLAMTPSAVNDIVKEFYNVLYYGYFDIDTETTDWARATMLMTYDQMLFDPNQPQLEIPENTAPTGSTGVDTNTVDPMIDANNF